MSSRRFFISCGVSRKGRKKGSIFKNYYFFVTQTFCYCNEHLFQAYTVKCLNLKWKKKAKDKYKIKNTVSFLIYVECCHLEI